MKLSIKIALLFFALVASIGGTLFFLKTRVAPPQNLTFDNAYTTDVAQGINRLSNISNDEETDSAYAAVTHYIAFLKDNERINDTEADKLLAQFTTTYVPVYAKRCQAKFTESVWPEAGLQVMNKHVEQIKALKNSQGASPLTAKERNDLQGVLSVISNYYQAKRAASVSFQGITAARYQISVANSWLKKEPINNCTALTNQLKDLASHLELAHYRSLGQKVEGLRYYGYNEDAYYVRYNNVKADIKEYKNEAPAVYGTSRSVDNLSNRAESYKENAKRYFYHKSQASPYGY